MRELFWTVFETERDTLEEKVQERQDKHPVLRVSLFVVLVIAIGYLIGYQWWGLHLGVVLLYVGPLVGGVVFLFLWKLIFYGRVFFAVFEELPQHFKTLFDSEGYACRKQGRYKGETIKKKIDNFCKKHNGLDYFILLAESKILSYVESEKKARKALKTINEAYTLYQETKMPFPNSLRNSAKKFWLVIKRGNALEKDIDALLNTLTSFIVTKKLLDIPPLPDLFAESIPNDISSLVADARERLVNLEEAHKEVEDYLATGE